MGVFQGPGTDTVIADESIAESAHTADSEPPRAAAGLHQTVHLIPIMDCRTKQRTVDDLYHQQQDTLRHRGPSGYR